MEEGWSNALTDTIVYFSGYQWLPGGNGRHDGLMEALAHHVRVIYAQPPKFSGSLAEFPRPRIERVRENFWLLHNVLGVRRSRAGRRLGRIAALIDSPWIERSLRDNGVENYTYWTSSSEPEAWWGIDPQRTVFDSIDPCFTSESQAKVDRTESAAAQKASLVFATAQSLLERMKRFNPNSYLLPNGAKQEDYHPLALADIPRPLLLAGRKGPVVGYMGTFDWRVDTETLTYAAKALPNFTFCLAGRVNADQEGRVAELRRLPNTIFAGAVSKEDGMAYTAHCDVAVIPFLPGPVGDAINPCKMYMYLMAGKPVVSTQMRECSRCDPLVRATGSAGEFAAAIKAAVADDTPERRASRTQFAMRNRWDDRAVEALAVLRKAGLLK